MKFNDKTLRDNNRRLLNFNRPEVEKVLPEHYTQEYPKLISLLNYYFEWMDSDGNPGRDIRDLYASRDATQVPDKLLQYLEDELLLGQAYFGGFLNKREAVKFSNLLYRSKGTKYSIEQFFRAFFGTDPVVEYPKENIFRVGPSIDYDKDSVNSRGGQIKQEASRLGPESRKFLTDDKLYQVLSILIKTDTPLADWIDVYKLFVHPAGVYLGAELQLTSVNSNPIVTDQDDIGDPIEAVLGIAETATISITTAQDQTFLLEGSAEPNGMRQIERQTIEQYQNLTVEELSSGYDYEKFLSPNSPSFDQDSTGIAGVRDYLVMSDSSYDGAGIDSDQYLKKPSFDLHKYSTQYDSAGS